MSAFEHYCLLVIKELNTDSARVVLIVVDKGIIVFSVFSGD